MAYGRYKLVIVVYFMKHDLEIINQWIGLRENLNRKPMGFYHQILRAFL